MEAISNKQGELDSYIAEGYKNALSEERRRYCFLVDRQCAVAKNSNAYHSKVRANHFLSAKIAWWSLSPQLQTHQTGPDQNPIPYLKYIFRKMSVLNSFTNYFLKQSLQQR